MTRDRRLILVVQGDAESTVASSWLETPCDDHGAHTMRKDLSGLPGVPQESAQLWVQAALREVLKEWCLCDAQYLAEGSLTDLLGALSGK